MYPICVAFILRPTELFEKAGCAEPRCDDFKEGLSKFQGDTSFSLLKGRPGPQISESEEHVSFSGSRVSFSGKHVSFSGNRVSFSGKHVSFTGNRASFTGAAGGRDLGASADADAESKICQSHFCPETIFRSRTARGENANQARRRRNEKNEKSECRKRKPQ